jgi:hypothetical protein
MLLERVFRGKRFFVFFLSLSVLPLFRGCGDLYHDPLMVSFGVPLPVLSPMFFPDVSVYPFIAFVLNVVIIYFSGKFISAKLMSDPVWPLSIKVLLLSMCAMWGLVIYFLILGLLLIFSSFVDSTSLFTYVGTFGFAPFFLLAKINSVFLDILWILITVVWLWALTDVGNAIFNKQMEIK